MKKIFTLFYLTAICSLYSFHGVAQWGFNREGLWVMDVCEAPDGNYFAAGVILDAGISSWNDNYIVKLDNNGNEIWHVINAGPYQYPEAMSVMPLADGSVVVYAMNDDDHPWFYKLDENGDLVWESSNWSDTIVFQYSNYTYASQLSDGSMVAVGYDYPEVWSIHVSTDGELLSETLLPDGFQSGGYPNKFAGMVTTLDGGWAACGSAGDNWVIWKFNALNEYQWHTILAKDDFENSLHDAFCQTSSGGYLLAASRNDTAILKRFDHTGNLSWEKTYAPSNANDGGQVAELTNGFIALTYEIPADECGFVTILDSMGGLVSEYQINMPDHPSYVAIDSVAIDTSYYYTYDTVPGSHGGIDVWSLEPTSDGGYTIAGRYQYDQYHFIIVKSNPDGSLEPCYFDCVWPGDADNNGVADMDDLLAIGIAYGKSGVERIDASINWLPHMAWPWADTLPDGTNLQFTDCNGDGTISNEDTLAVSLNYASIHNVNSFKPMDTDIKLFIQDPGMVLDPGYHELPIMLGDATSVADAIYGLRFSIQYTGGIADLSSFKISFSDSWFGSTAELLQMNKNFPGEMKIDAALVRTDQINTSGYGQIGTLGFEIIGNTGEMTLSIIDEHAIDKEMNEIPLLPQTVVINGLATGLNNSASGGIKLYPNPASDEIIIETSGNTLETLQIFDITGQFIKSISGEEMVNKIIVKDLIPGSYILKAKMKNLTIVRNLIIIR